MKTKLGIYILFLILGILLGASAVLVLYPTSVEKVEVPVYKEIIKIKKDTAKFKTKRIIKNVDNVVTTAEDTSSYLIDTLNEQDTISIDDVLTESIILTKTIKVNPLKEIDSTAYLLNVYVPSFSELIQIEYWNSPLQLTGYELSKNKLKLFGFDPSQQLVLSERNDKGLDVYFDDELHIFYKTNKFTALEQ